MTACEVVRSRFGDHNVPATLLGIAILGIPISSSSSRRLCAEGPPTDTPCRAIADRGKSQAGECRRGGPVISSGDGRLTGNTVTVGRLMMDGRVEPAGVRG